MHSISSLNGELSSATTSPSHAGGALGVGQTTSTSLSHAGESLGVGQYTSTSPSHAGESPSIVNSTSASDHTVVVPSAKEMAQKVYLY